MPRRKAQEEAPEEEQEQQEQEEEAPEDEEQDEGMDEEQVEEEAEEQYGGLSLQIAEDSVSIELPRDGNEKKTLDGIGKLLDNLE